MSTPPSDHATRRANAATRLAERRRRVRAIRGRVVGLSLATLLATSGAVLVEIVTGNDPALAGRSAATTTTATTGTASTGTGTAAATTSSAAGGGTAATGATTTRTSSASQPTTPSTVTTSAS